MDWALYKFATIATSRSFEQFTRRDDSARQHTWGTLLILFVPATLVAVLMTTFIVAVWVIHATHEWGHLLVGRFFGWDGRTLKLGWLPVAVFSSDAARILNNLQAASSWDLSRIIVQLAGGPLTNIVIAGILWAALHLGQTSVGLPGTFSLGTLSVLSAISGLMNIVPWTMQMNLPRAKLHRMVGVEPTEDTTQVSLQLT